LKRIGDGEYDEIITYNDPSNIVEEQQERQLETLDTVWDSKGIRNHHGPLSSDPKDNKVSSYNVLVELENRHNSQ
jgi:hypothetical protein